MLRFPLEPILELIERVEKGEVSQKDIEERVVYEKTRIKALTAVIVSPKDEFIVGIKTRLAALETAASVRKEIAAH